MSPEAAALVRSVCFNDDSDLTKSLRANLVDSGTVHIISTSGLHVALLSGILFGLFRKLPIPRWAQIALLAMILLLYVAAAGWRPPRVRRAGTDKLAKIMNSGAKLSQAYGPDLAKSIRRRLDELDAAISLDEMRTLPRTMRGNSRATGPESFPCALARTTD